MGGLLIAPFLFFYTKYFALIAIIKHKTILQIWKQSESWKKKHKSNYLKVKKVRTLWDNDTEEWYFSVVDVVAVLTDSVNPTDYIKKMRKRDPLLAEGWGQLVTPPAVDTAGGNQKTNFSTMEGILRIIQSIPSHKAEPFKLWLAFCCWYSLW